MPTNGNSSQSDTLLNNAAASPAKKSKPRSGRTARKSSSSAPARPAAPRVSEPAEILFKDLPNPYHAPQPPYIWIDHPEQAERLLAPIYVVRLGAGGATQVEICFDGGVWQTCRLTSGYWWFDWSNIQPGRHTLTARMQATDGRWFRTPPRTCEFRP